MGRSNVCRITWASRGSLRCLGTHTNIYVFWVSTRLSSAVLYIRKQGLNWLWMKTTSCFLGDGFHTRCRWKTGHEKWMCVDVVGKVSELVLQPASCRSTQTGNTPTKTLLNTKKWSKKTVGRFAYPTVHLCLGFMQHPGLFGIWIEWFETAILLFCCLWCSLRMVHH